MRFLQNVKMLNLKNVEILNWIGFTKLVLNQKLRKTEFSCQKCENDHTKMHYVAKNREKLLS